MTRTTSPGRRASSTPVPGPGIRCSADCRKAAGVRSVCQPKDYRFCSNDTPVCQQTCSLLSLSTLVVASDHRGHGADHAQASQHTRIATTRLGWPNGPFDDVRHRHRYLPQMHGERKDHHCLPVYRINNQTVCTREKKDLDEPGVARGTASPLGSEREALQSPDNLKVSGSTRSESWDSEPMGTPTLIGLKGLCRASQRVLVLLVLELIARARTRGRIPDTLPYTCPTVGAMA